MALSLPAVYVTSTSFCQVLCSHFLLAAFTTVPWISFITLVYGCGKRKKRMMEYSLLLLALQRLFQSPSMCGCFVGWVFNCYSGTELLAPSCSVPAGKAESSWVWLGSGGLPLWDLTVGGWHRLHPLAPCLLDFSLYPLTWLICLCLLVVSHLPTGL